MEKEKLVEPFAFFQIHQGVRFGYRLSRQAKVFD
jgi:hypothetical protein